jgi:magnesium transporter
MLLESISRLSRRSANAHIRRLLLKSHPSEIAEVIRHLSLDEGIKVLNHIKNSKQEPQTFAELEGGFLQTYLEHTSDKVHVAEVLQKLPEDETAGLLADVDEEQAQEILSLMHGETQEEVKEILQYGEDTCGRIMAVNVFALDQGLTAKEAISEIQQSSNLESLFYVYIIDEFENLVGVVSMRQVLQVEPERKLKDFMNREMVRANVYDSQEKAANYVEEYNFVSLPVVDDQGKLVGMVTVDDVIDYIRDEAQDEVLQLAGVEPEAIDDFSYSRAFWSRLLWFGLLFIGGILSSEIILHFFASYPREFIYLCFVPLVLRMGGSVATQCITFVHQGIINVDIEKSRAKKALWGQNFITFLVVVFLGGVVFSYAYFRLDNDMWFSISLSLALLLVSFVSMLLGTALPFAFNRIKFDSLLASSRFVHFLMDALSLYVYFQFLWLWQENHISVLTSQLFKHL